MSATIGFLGAGVMGAGMVRRLLDAGHAVTVWQRRPDSHHALRDAGAAMDDDLPRLIAASDIVLGCLLNTQVTREAYLGASGVLAHARPDCLLIEHGTFDPQLASEIADAADARGAHFLDAPVTGGPEGAAQGTLTTMVGGSANALDRLRHVVGAYCGTIEHVGASGSGQRLKLINQLLVSIHVVAAAEAAALVLRTGIDVDVAERVLMGGWAASTMLGRVLPRACAGDFADTGATIGKLTEVQPLIAEMLDASDVRPLLFGRAHAAFDASVEAGAENSDLSALVQRYPIRPHV